VGCAVTLLEVESLTKRYGSLVAIAGAGGFIAFTLWKFRAEQPKESCLGE